MSTPIHKGTNQHGTLKTNNTLPICRACGTQYQTTTPLKSCRICDDPRQYVPAAGQKFTTMGELQQSSAGHKLVFKQEEDPKVWAITIEPSVGIGQRAFLIQTERGNVLWDLVCYLDEKAVEKINSLGGLSLIIISHPHFYTTWHDWSETFNNIPVYLASADKSWLNRPPISSSNPHFLTETHTTLLPGVTAIIAGGHFPGSMALHTDSSATTVPSLFHADTIHTVVNALSPDIDAKHADARALPPNTTTPPPFPSTSASASTSPLSPTSYTFMYSIPNMIPLSPDTILSIWRTLKGFQIEATYGFVTVRNREGDRTGIPERILQSAKMCVWNMTGGGKHEIFGERVG